MIEPWTFDFKGTARADEPEAKIEARLLAEPNLICAVDAHAMTGGPILGGAGPNAEVVRAIAREIVANLECRYLIRYLTDAAPRQLTLETHPAQQQTNDDGSVFTRTVRHAPAYHLYYENVGQLPDVHATVMQTDLAAEINLTILRHVAQSLKK